MTISAAEFQRLVYSAHLHTQLAEKPELAACLQVLLELHRRNPNANPAALADLSRQALERYRTNAPAYIRTSGFRDEILAGYLEALRQVPARTDFVQAHLQLLNGFMSSPDDYTNASPAELIHSGNQRLLSSEGEATKRQAVADACMARAQGNAAFAAAMDGLPLPESPLSVGDTPAAIIGNTNSALHGDLTLQTLLALSAASGNGSLTVSSNQLMDLFTAETQTLWDTIHTNLALQVEFNQSQPDLLSYLTNQAAIAAHEARVAAVQQGQARKIASATAAVLVQSKLIEAKEPLAEIPGEIRAIIEVVASVASACASEPPDPGAFITAGLGVFDLVAGTESPEDTMVREIGNIKTLIGDLSTNMNYRFDRVDQSLTTIFDTLNQQFDLIVIVDGKINDISDKVAAIRRSLVDVQTGLHRLERHLSSYVDQLYARGLSLDFNTYLGYEATYFSPMVQADYNTTEARFFTHARNNAVDGLSAPYADRDYSPAGLFNELTETTGGSVSNRLDQNVKYIKKYLADQLNQPTAGKLEDPSGNGVVGNPRDWFVGAYAYAQLAVENPGYFRQVNPATRLDLVRNRGNDLTNFFRSLTFSGPTINWSLQNTIVTNYVGKLNSFNTQVSATEQQYASANGFALDTWRQWSAAAPRVTATATEVLVSLPKPLIAAGGVHSLALKPDGNLVGWGNNDHGQATAVPSGPPGFVRIGGQRLTNVLALAAGERHSLALKPDGTVVGWGDNSSGRSTIPASVSTARALAAGNRHSLALKPDGTVVGWGDNASGQTNSPVGLNNAVAVAAGGAHSLALKADGTVVGWGANGSGQTNTPSGLNNVVAVAAGAAHSLALKADGTVVGWGAGGPGPSGYALSFNRTNHVRVANFGSRMPTAEVTVEFWQRLHAVTDTFTFALYNNANNYFEAHVPWKGENDGRVYWRFGSEAGSLAYAPTDSLGGTWQHFALVAKVGTGGYMRIYRNGVQVAEGASASAPFDGGHADLTLGGGVDGELDEFRIWNVARTGTEIRTNMLQRLTGTETNLVAYWKLDEGSGTTATNSAAVTGNAATGTIESSPTWVNSTLPGWGQALAFDGTDDHVDLGTSAPTLGPRFTEEAWIYPQISDTSKYYGFIGHEPNPGDAVSRSPCMYVFGQTRLHAGFGTPNGQWAYHDTTNVLRPYAWNHVAATYDGAFYHVYVNGQQVLKEPETRIPTNSPVRYIGRIRDSFFPGLMDEVRIWNVARSQAEIQACMAQPLDGTESGLVAYYRFDEGSGATARDATISHRDGTISGPSWGFSTVAPHFGQTTIPANATNVMAIAAGAWHSLALLSNGTVVAWGLNDHGQCDPPPGLTNVVAIAAGANHSLALKADGTLVAWGNNQCTPRGWFASPRVRTHIAGGGYHSLALKADGTVGGWGAGTNRTGSATFDFGQVMIPISATNVVALTAGLYHSLALKADCTVVGWGAGQSGDSYVQNYFYDQAKPSSRATNVLAIAAGKFHTLALKADGTVVGWGYNYHGQATGVPKTTTPPISSGLVSVSGETLSNMVAIAAGGNHSLALKADGSVVGWGYTVEGQSTIPSSANGAVAIAEGNSHCLALKPDGTVVGWGNNYYGQATGVATNSSPPYYASGIVIVSGQKLSNVVAIAAGDSHSLALKADGTVVGWGANGRGQTTIPASATNNVVAIAAGLAHSLALKADGTLVVWGYNLLRQTNTPANVTDLAAWGERPAGLWNIPSVSSPITAVASGSAHNVALTASGSVLAWGLNTWGEINVPLQAQSGVQAIGSGLGHNLALTANGSVLAWGLNDFGQTNVPTSAQSGVVAISVGGKHNLALRTNGTVVAWGLNGSGQTNVPPNLQGKVVAIGAGGEHSLALKADGAVVAWGGNTSGQTNVLPQAQSGVVAIAAGRYHNLALKSTGQVVAWGLNSSGQCDVPAEAQSGVVAVAAGYRQSLALMADGSVVRWGRNNSTIPASATNVVAIAAGDTHSLFLTASGAAGSAGSGGMESVRAQIPRGLPFFLRGGNDSVIAELGRVGPLQSTGTELSGAKALLAAVLELGMPYTLERDDVLHGFLYGSESLVDLDASRTFLEAENVRQQAAPDSPPVLLPDVAVLRYQRLADRLNLCLTNLAATGQPEIPRLVGHTYARARAGA